MTEIRVGQGIDVHGFSGESGELSLGCVKWPESPLLEGHSDGDVVAHALCDALLLAGGIGDLGSIFGTDRPEWKGASGETLLRHVLRLLVADGWSIQNAVIQLIGQKPRVSARRLEVEQRLSALIAAPVSFGATTTDHLGFLGRGEGLAALATTLISR